MIWARMLAYITGTVDQELLLRNEYLAAENRILRAQIEMSFLTVRVWHKISFTCQFRHPETVVSIGGKQLQERRPGMSGIAHGNVHLVGRNDADLRVAELPPVLVSNHSDFYGIRRLGSILDGVDHACSRQK